jgi:hypothetical protein
VGRRLVVLPLVALLLATGLAGVTAATPPRAAASGDSSPETLRILLDRLDPKAPRPGTQLRFDGRVENRSGADVTDLQVRLRTGTRPVGSRSELAVLALRHDTVGFVVPGTQVDAAPTLPPGGQVSWTLTVSADRLGYAAAFGVYPVQLEVRGRSGGGEPRTLARVTTFLPWAPPTASVAPTRLVWLWPLAATPAQRPDGSFLDDGLGGDLAAGGRLRRLADAAASASRTPVTWVVDPALLAAVADMSDGYLVRSSAGPARPGRAASVARTWLTEVRRLTRGRSVLALPFADPDVVALERAGMDGDLGYQTRAGRQITRETLGTAAVEGLAWPPDGLLTRSALETLLGAGTRSLVLADVALRPPDSASYTRDARADLDTVAGPLPTALTDTALTATLAEAQGSDDARLVEQRFLAETALITAELPGRSRTVVVAPPRRWDPPGRLATDLLADTAATPWLVPTPLAPVLAGPNRGETVDVARLRYPDDMVSELDGAHLASIASLAREVRLVRAVLIGDTPLATDLLFCLFRTGSAAWREDPGTGNQVLRAVRADVDAMRRGTGIASAGLFTLTSRSGSVPLTVANELDESVRVRIAVRALNSAALSTPPPTTVTIAARQKPTIPLPVIAHVNGVIPVTAQLLTPDGRPLSPAVVLRVRSTAYGQVGLTVTLGAFAVLLVAVAVRLVRRGLRAAHSRASRG